MKKVIEKKLKISSNNRDVDRLYQEFFSMDKNIAEFKFTLENLVANKVICLFYFKKSKRYSTVDAKIEDNTFTVKFDTSLITTDEPVVGYIYFEKVEKSADVYSFQFNVRVSELDKAKNAPVIEQKTGRIVDIDSIVTRTELEEILKTVHVASDAYDDSEIIRRLALLEAKPEIDTSGFATKEELQNISLTPGPQGLQGPPGPIGQTGERGPQGDVGPKGADGVGIPQKISINGNVVSLSDGGGSITLPTAAPSNTGGQVHEYEIHGTGMPNGKVSAPVGTTYVDTAVTNKALKWIKRSGNDNQGWEVLMGDTGWINLPIVSKLGASYLKIRRVNNMVTYQFGGLDWGWFGIVRRGGPGYVIQPSDRDRNCYILGLNGIPQGFRSEFSLIGGIYNDKGTPYGTWYLGGTGDSSMLRFQFTDPVPTNKDIGDIRISSISYLTSDPWPTRLP